MTSATS